MENSKKSERKGSASFSIASQVGECASFRYLCGPPFNQRDYMMSPSDSASVSVSERNSDILKKKLTPSDIKIDSKYFLDSQKALRKLSELIKDGLAEHLVKRLEDLVQVFLRGSPMGFLLDDLSLVIEIVEFFSRNRTSVPKFTEFVEIIMAFAIEPPKVGKASDVLRFKETLTDYFTLFGELLATFEDECFQLSLLEALDCLIIRRKLVDLSCIKVSFCHEAMETSQLPCIVAALLETVPNSLYLHYVELALQLVWVSVRAGFAMAKGNVIEFVLRRIDLLHLGDCSEELLEKDEEWHEYYKLLDKSAYLIWSLFAIINKYNIEIPVPKKEALRSLKNVFLREAKKKSQKAVHTRNCWAGILVKLCAVNGDRLDLKETGLDEDIAALSVATEIKSEITWVADMNFAVNKDDYALKKLMLLCCCLFAQSQELKSTLEHHKVIEGVLRLINPKTTLPWIPSQFSNLLFIGLLTLSELVPKFPETYLSCKGNLSCCGCLGVILQQSESICVSVFVKMEKMNFEQSYYLHYIQHYIQFLHLKGFTPTKIKVEMDSIYDASAPLFATLNFGLLSTIKWLVEEYFDQDSMLEALKTFCIIITCDLDCIIEDAKAQGSVQVLLDVCSRLLNVAFMKLDHQEKICRIFVTLERLVRNDATIQKYFGDSCVSVSMKLFQRILADSENDSKWNWNLFLSFGAFLWEAIAWCSSSLKSFIEKGGIFLFLDFLESSSFPVQMLYLGILVDMTDEGETIAHLLTWRGKNGAGILNLMIDIWRKEEYLTKVHRTRDGIILDVEAPLMTEEQWYLTHQVIGGHIYSPSIAEMICSARPKIHALYQFLQRRYFELTQIGESAYCLQLKAIKPSYQIYIPLIEHFLAFKMGEVWFEVIQDINISGVFPTAFNGHVVCTLLDEKNKWASRIKAMQEDIILMQEDGGAGEEKKLYNFLRSCQKPNALEALHELDYVARTSFQKFQKQKKNKQIKEVNKSSPLCEITDNSNVHRTFMFDGRTTISDLNKRCNDCFENLQFVLLKFMNFKNVWVKSEKVTEETEDLPLVSPLSPSENLLNYPDDI